MKRQRAVIGAVVEIPINNGEYYIYAQMIPNGSYAFFDHKFESKLNDLAILQSLPVLFYASIFRDVVSTGIWLKVGKIPIRSEFYSPMRKYIYHDYETDVNRKFEIYDCDTGIIMPATKEDIEGLESCSVWDAATIEDRIVSHYNNAGCIELKEDYELFGFPQNIKHDQIIANVQNLIFKTKERNSVYYEFIIDGHTYKGWHDDFLKKYQIGNKIKVIYSVVNPDVNYCADWDIIWPKKNRNL